jgi:hypothetical protein
VGGGNTPEPARSASWTLVSQVVCQPASQPASQPAMQPTRFKHVQWLFVFGIGCSTVARVMHLKWYVGERKHRVQVASNRVIECSTDARIMF